MLVCLSFGLSETTPGRKNFSLSATGVGAEATMVFHRSLGCWIWEEIRERESTKWCFLRGEERKSDM